ncbi:hypothetical protein TPDSL_03610 [Terrisporobacter petrolearius]|uniref:recombinase family protein n=1 Tax=Terrisporobacter petrolearius TaxID=1460447 RepID=UPI0033677737
MKKVTKIEQVELVSLKKIRVATYCRVSTASDDQILSLYAQKEHYENYIKSNTDWEYAGLYYDEGISGTKKESREGLLNLVDDCEKGLIDLVITKSISRFSRNTTDCLELVRKLLTLDIAVYFEKEDINTFSMESELMLSILASMAEEESVSISQNSKWSVKKRFETGTFKISYPPYGYDNVRGEMVIVPEQAEVVKRIFADTLEGKSTHVIAKALNEVGVKTKRGGKWSAGTVKGIIGNEKYTGDVLFQKTFTDDNFNRHTNYGEHEQYFCKNHHTAIISHEIFDKANAAMRQRGLEKGNTGDRKKYQQRYVFSGKIKCGECGGTFKRRKHYTTSGSYIAWCCANHIDNVDACSMKYIRDDTIKNAFIIMMNKLRYGSDLVLKPLLIAICTTNEDKNKSRLSELTPLIERNVEQRKNISELLSKGYLDSSVFIKTNNDLLMEYSRLQGERDFIIKVDETGYSAEQDVKNLISYLNKQECVMDFEEDTFLTYIDGITVPSREEICFEFKCGLKLTERV